MTRFNSNEWWSDVIYPPSIIKEEDMYDNINFHPKRKGGYVDSADPKIYPYQIGSQDFKSLSEAEGFAKRLAAEEHEDVVIKQRVSVVRFPLPDLKVESLVQA